MSNVHHDQGIKY